MSATSASEDQMPQSSSSDDIEIAFIVDAELLQRLVSVIREVAGNALLYYRVGFDDRTSVKYTNIEDVLGLANLGGRRIRELQLTAVRRGPIHALPRTWYRRWFMRLRNIIVPTSHRSATDTDLLMSVTFDDGPYGPAIQYRIDGDEREVFDLTNAVRDIVAMARAWYSRIATAEYFIIGFTLYFVMSFSIVFWADSIGATNAFNRSQRAVQIVTLLAAVALPLPVLLAFGRFTKWLFPTATFEIGEGKKRSARLRFWRNLLGFGILLSFAVSLAAGALLQ